MPSAELAAALIAVGAVTSLGAALAAQANPHAPSRMWSAVGIPLMCAIPSAAALVAMQLAHQAVVGGTTPAGIAIGAAALGLSLGVGLVALLRASDPAPGSATRRDAIVIGACALVSLVVVGAGEVPPLDAQLLLIAALAWCWKAQPPLSPHSGPGDAPRSGGPGSKALIGLAGAILCAAGVVLGVFASLPNWTIELSLVSCGLTSALFAYSHRESHWIGSHAVCAVAIGLTASVAVGSASIAHVLDMAGSLPEWSLSGVDKAIGISLAAAPRIKGLTGALPQVVLVIAAIVAFASVEGAQGARIARRRSVGAAVVLAVMLIAAMRIAAQFRS